MNKKGELENHNFSVNRLLVSWLSSLIQFPEWPCENDWSQQNPGNSLRRKYQYDVGTTTEQ